MKGAEPWAVTRRSMRWAIHTADFMTAPLLPPRPAPDPAQVRSLLLIRRGSFGDLILLLPALERARQLFPRASITLMVQHGYSRFLQQARLPVALWGVRNWWHAARAHARDFEAAIALRADPRCLWLGRRHARWLAGSGIRGGRALLDCEVPFPRGQEAAVRWMGMVEAAAGIPVSNAAVRPHLRLAPEWEAAGLQIWPAVAPAPLLLHPGCGTPAKRWPWPYWVALARRCAQAGWPVLITGGPGDHRLAAALAAACGGGAVNLAGYTGWDALAGLAARARAVVAPDTGVIHLARALGTPTVALFGPQPPAVWGAGGYGPGREPIHLSLVHTLPCSFCSRGRCPRCRGGGYSPCMQALGVEEVWRALLAVLEAAKPALAAGFKSA